MEEADFKRDFLTDFYSKEAFEPLADKMMAECGVRKRPFSILIVDLDHFKYFNDKYGHLNGDDALKYFAGSVRFSLYAAEYKAVRFGGDEFILIFPGVDSAHALTIARNLLKAVGRRPFSMMGHLFNMRFSGGIASYPEDGSDAKILFDKADKAMYFSKGRGGNRIAEFGKMRFEGVKHLLFMFAVIFLAAAVTFGARYLYKNRAVFLAKNFSVAKIMDIIPSRDRVKDRDIIYLKTGGVFKGEISRENPDAVEIKMKFLTGEGTMTVKRSEIVKIYRGKSVPGS